MSKKLTKCGIYTWSSQQGFNKLRRKSKLTSINDDNLEEWQKQNIEYWKEIHKTNTEDNLPSILNLRDVDNINKDFVVLWSCSKPSSKIFAINVLSMMRIMSETICNLLTKTDIISKEEFTTVDVTKYTTLLIPVILNPITQDLWSFTDLNKFVYWYKKSIHNKIVEYHDELELEHKKTKSGKIKEQLSNIRKVISSTIWTDMPKKDEYNQRHSKQYFMREWASRLYSLVYYIYWIPTLLLLLPITIGISTLSLLASSLFLAVAMLGIINAFLKIWKETKTGEMKSRYFIHLSFTIISLVYTQNFFNEVSNISSCGKTMCELPVVTKFKTGEIPYLGKQDVSSILYIISTLSNTLFTKTNNQIELELNFAKSSFEFQRDIYNNIINEILETSADTNYEVKLKRCLGGNPEVMLPKLIKRFENPINVEDINPDLRDIDNSRENNSGYESVNGEIETNTNINTRANVKPSINSNKSKKSKKRKPGNRNKSKKPKKKTYRNNNPFALLPINN